MSSNKPVDYSFAQIARMSRQRERAGKAARFERGLVLPESGSAEMKQIENIADRVDQLIMCLCVCIHDATPGKRDSRKSGDALATVASLRGACPAYRPAVRLGAPDRPLPALSLAGFRRR